VPTDTSVAFIVTEAQMGPVDGPTRLISLDQFTATYGQRIPGTYGYDSVDAAFHDGVSAAYVQRLVQGAVAATGDAIAITGGVTATLDAANPGAWGNNAALDLVTAPGGLTLTERTRGLTYAEPEPYAAGYIATVSLAGKAVQTSVPLATVSDLVAFLAAGRYLRLTADNPTAALAVEGSVALAGGSDGTLPVADGSLVADALALIPPELGPGQVTAPGRTDVESHVALLTHAAGTQTAGVNRVAFLDGGPTDDKPTLEGRAQALRGALEDRYGSLWAPWAVIPGLAPGTTRTVPWSAIQAGLCARVDAGGNPNQAAAGPWGESRYALDLTATYTKTEMEDLLYAGVNTARRVYGRIEAYGFRTLVDPAGPRQEWRELNHARLNMAIVAQSDAVGEDLTFAQLDGRGHTVAKFNGRLAAMLKTFYEADALFGEDVTEAFIVNTGPSVNTPEVAADGRMKAVLAVRMSPHAELVQIEIVKYPITVALAG
jgi:hypothetical protein